MTAPTVTMRLPEGRLVARPLVGKPRLRGWLNLVCFEASLCLGTLLIVTASPGHRFAASVYAGSVSLLFGASALYHRGHWSPRWYRTMARIDHAMIFVLIGGSATPLYLLCLRPSLGVPLLAVFAGVLAVSLVVHVVWIDAPERLVTGMYIALGLAAGGAVPGVLIHTGVTAFTLLLTGGAVYIVGAILFAAYRPDPRPDIFGYHEVWHCFVCAAAALHYVAIAAFVL